MSKSIVYNQSFFRSSGPADAAVIDAEARKWLKHATPQEIEQIASILVQSKTDAGEGLPLPEQQTAPH